MNEKQCLGLNMAVREIMLVTHWRKCTRHIFFKYNKYTHVHDFVVSTTGNNNTPPPPS